MLKTRPPKNILKTDFKERGKYPIIDQSENFIAGYWNDESNLLKIEKPVIIFGDHTRGLQYVDFNFVLEADDPKILNLFKKLVPKFFYYILLNT